MDILNLNKSFAEYKSNKAKFWGIFLIALSIFSIYFALNPNLYSSKTVIKTSENLLESDPTNGLAGFLSIGGLDNSDRKREYVIEKLRSFEFSQELRDIELFEKGLFAYTDYDKENKQLITDSSVVTADGVWLFKNQDGYIGRPSPLKFYEELHNRFIIDFNRLNNYLTITFMHESAYLTREFLFQIVNKLNELEIAKVIDQTSRSIDYINTQYTDYGQKEVKDVLNKLIEKELNNQMFANVNKEYLVEFVDKPFIPEEKSGLKFWQKFVVALIISFIIAYAFLFLNLFLKGFKNKLYS